MSCSGRRPMNGFLKFILIALSLILLVIAIVAVYFWNKLDLITYADEVEFVVSTEPFEEYTADLSGLEISETVPVIQDTEIRSEDDVQNILLLGTDERSKDFNFDARADCIILVSINKDKKTVNLVSFERAIGVPILEGDYEGQYDMLTHIFRWGGSELVAKTIEHCFKIDIDHYVRLNFASVMNIVDTIGGIDVYLTAREAEAINSSHYENYFLKKEVIMTEGINHLNGAAALAFARLRNIDSDWQRVERQRKVILGVVDKLKDSDLMVIDDLADAVLPMIQTDMTKMDITGLVLYAPNFLMSEFDQMTIPKQGTYGGMKIRTPGGAFAVDYEINNDLLHRFLYEGATSEELLAE